MLAWPLLQKNCLENDGKGEDNEVRDPQCYLVYVYTQSWELFFAE